MKKFLPLGLAALLSVLLLASAQRPARARMPQGDLEGRVAELEEALAAEVKAGESTRKTLEEIRSYLESQALSAKKLSATLDQADDLGFTKGINFESRQVLLRGWHSALDAAQEGVPKSPRKTRKGETPRPLGSRSGER